MNPKDIQDVRFSKSMSGYKADEVDLFCDKVYEDYIIFAEALKAKQEKIEKLEAELADKESSAESINTVLISAQKLADSILADAKKQAEEIISNANNEAEHIKQRTKKALEEIDSVITAQKNEAAKESEAKLLEAARKTEGMILAAKDSVAREQLLFDKLKSEVAAFKTEIKNAYKAHLEALSALPEEVPVNPEQAAIAIEEIIKNQPDLTRFVEKPEPIEELPFEESVETEEVELEAKAEEQTEEQEAPAELKKVIDDMSAGFIVTPIDDN